MRGKLSGALALACAALATPAAAQSQALLDCVPSSLDASYRSAIADAARRGGLDAIAGRLRDTVNRCADQYNLTSQQRPSYFAYSLNRIERDDFAAKLAALQIPTSVIDDAVGFGPGRPNPLFEGSLPDDQVNAMYGALRQSGVDVKAVEGGTWSLIGIYMQASSSMWNAWKNLR